MYDARVDEISYYRAINFIGTVFSSGLFIFSPEIIALSLLSIPWCRPALANNSCRYSCLPRAAIRTSVGHIIEALQYCRVWSRSLQLSWGVSNAALNESGDHEKSENKNIEVIYEAQARMSRREHPSCSYTPWLHKYRAFVLFSINCRDATADHEGPY